MESPGKYETNMQGFNKENYKDIRPWSEETFLDLVNVVEELHLWRG